MMMQQHSPGTINQIQAAIAALTKALDGTLLAVYLHGSAVSGGLRPQSDIDLLAIVDHDITDEQRSDLLTALLHVSGRHPAQSEDLRCIEAIVFRRSDLIEARFPIQAEFTYGEWLRSEFEAGKRPVPTRGPEHTLVLAQAHHQAISLFNPGASKFLPEVPLERIRQAMRDTLPALLAGVQGDERNILLTLARMWYTASTGKFTTKDAAASWAIPQMPDKNAAILDYARRSYLGEIADKWDKRSSDVKRLVAYLLARTTELL